MHAQTLYVRSTLLIRVFGIDCKFVTDVPMSNKTYYYSMCNQVNLFVFSVTHNCIIATVTLFHPDGREARNM